MVRCASEFFLVDLDRVRRMEDRLTIHTAPISARGFLGLARFGGEALTIFSPEVLAGGRPCARQKEMTVVVVEIGGADPPQRLGLAVDEALEIVSLDETCPTQAVDRIVSEYFDLGGRQARRFNIEALGTQGETGLIGEDIEERE